MKKIKMTALVLCASMLAGTAGCYATDKPDMTSFSQTEAATETSTEDTQAVSHPNSPGSLWKALRSMSFTWLT